MTPPVSTKNPQFQPSTATYYNAITQTLQLNSEELDVLARHGFVVSERLPFEQFKRAFAYIYRKDLPVLITTDSILHAMHQTYDKLLAQVEMTIFTLKLHEILTGVRDYLRNAAQRNQDTRLEAVYRDLDIYLSVPLALLDNATFWRPSTEISSNPIEEYLVPIMTINLGEYHRGRTIHTFKEDKFVEITLDEVGTKTIDLFGLKREVDFTLFQARGHYDEPFELRAYFTAMMWLGLIDFQLVGYTPTGEPQLQIGQLVATHLLRDAFTATQQRETWETVDQLLNAFVGWSDNVTLNGLDQFIEDAAITEPADYFEADPVRLLQLLTDNDYGRQHIRGQGQQRASNLEETLPHTVSFSLMGQRFTIESYIMGELIFDKLAVDGQLVKRAYPSPLDVMAALGNDRALDHLRDEFARFGYQSRLLELRQEIDTTSHEFWQNSFYNLWLNAIRALNRDTTNPAYPAAMRSATWADKTLHCQLAAWTQLRHDNILYVKPPFEPRSGCDFPAGYVEPYPEFFAAVADYARFGRNVFAQLPIASNESPTTPTDDDEGWFDTRPLPVRALQTLEKAVTYFAHLESAATTLQSLAQKELSQEPFTEADTLFLRSVVVRKYVGDRSYGGRTEEEWDGWYVGLLPFGDETPILVADVYTNTNSDIGIPGVLHTGLGDPVAMLFLAETPQGQAMFVGPAFTYYEHLEQGLPPCRLTDEEWHRLYNGYGRKKITLPLPEWTHNFRLSSDHPNRLQLPDAWESLGIDEALQRRIFEAIRSEPNATAHVRGFGIRAFCELVRTNPSFLLRVEGFDAPHVEALIEQMISIGYLDSSPSEH